MMNKIKNVELNSHAAIKGTGIPDNTDGNSPRHKRERSGCVLSLPMKLPVSLLTE